MGDYNGDGLDDLAIGTPHEDISIAGTNHVSAGVVIILYGAMPVISGTHAQVISQANLGNIGFNPQSYDFGSSAEFVGSRGGFEANDQVCPVGVEPPTRSLRRWSCET
ncbi:FG-GAP repeat protein, partial [Thiolapillus sp.]|uniref:FG-GAP repeat protein n=1 Tax=Thiolapillus sp. TaxID=2017437 RepID=UPI003AF8957B